MATDTEKYAAVVQTFTAVGIGGLLLKGKATPSSSNNQFPPEVMTILQALATGLGTTVDQLTQILAAIAAIPGGGGGGGSFQGWPSNADYVSTVLIQCAAINTAYPVPSMAVPDNFSVLIKAYPTNNPNSLIYVITNSSVNINSAYTLLPNESVAFKIKDTGKIYLFTNLAGSQATVSVEQRSS